MSDFYDNNNNNMPNVPPVPPQAPVQPQAQVPAQPQAPAQDEAKVYRREDFSRPRVNSAPQNKPPQAPPRAPYPYTQQPGAQAQPYTQAPNPQYQPPQAPQQAQPQAPRMQPPQAPQVQQNYNSPYTSAPVYQQPQYAQPPQSSGAYNPNYAYTPKPSNKKSMSSGAKAFVITVIALLSAGLIGFIAYVSLSSGDRGFQRDTTPNDYSFTVPSGANPFATEAPTEAAKKYTESDRHKDVNPKFKGLKLHKKPGKKAEHSTSASFKKVEKSVVGIICYTEDQQGTSTSYTTMGSGTVITSDGYILTNAHIISNSRTSYLIKIITADKKEYKAGVVGYDSRYDLAVLKADAKNLKPASFGNSRQIEVAEDVIVVGNPRSLNYQNSVTKGIISATNRQVSITNNARFIQTDAAINPGNSGGPLCNMYGQVIGISTSKIALEEYEGMCFAIPSNTAKTVVDSIIRHGYVRNRVKIGIVGTVALKSEDGTYGIKIGEISKSGPMDGTGANIGDIITKVDGKNVTTFAEVYDVLENHKKGDKIKVTLYRPDTGKTYDVTVTLQEDKSEE